MRRNRRDFLKSSGLGAVALATLPVADADATPVEIPYRLVLVGDFDPRIEQLRSIAYGPKDHLHAAGAAEVQVFDSQKRSIRTMKTSGPVWALAVGEDGYVYAAQTTKIEKFSPEGRLEIAWGKMGKKPGEFLHITGLAVAGNVLYVADAGNRRLHRFAINGDFVDARDGFNIPSPFFDCVADARGVVHVANTAEHRVERYDANGHSLGAWGKSGQAPDRFSGCCNPTNLALFADGRTATSEKGIPRLKVHDASGKMIAHLGAEHFPDKALGMDLAINSKDEIALLEPVAGRIRFYEVRPGAPPRREAK